jgi:outer membrane immunogenic protein
VSAFFFRFFGTPGQDRKDGSTFPGQTDARQPEVKPAPCTKSRGIKLMRKLVAGKAVCALLSSPAWAGGPGPTIVDPVVAAPVATAPDRFAGVYGGLSLGGGSADGTLTLDVVGGGTFPTPYAPSSETAYGAFAGYNFQKGNLVYGIDAQYLSLGDLEDVAAEINDVWDLRARAGVQSGSVLFYASLGWSWVSATQTTTGNGYSLDGMNYGLGLEYQTGGAFFLGADYTMRNLDGSVNPTLQLEADVNTLSLRAGYRF